MTMIIAALSAVAGFFIGVAVASYLCYHWLYSPLFQYYESLVKDMQNMKRQGFVPQYEFKQKKELDLSENIVEY